MDNSTEIKVTLDSLTFNTADYTLFVGMLVVSTAIGIYFGVYKKQKTLSEYLLGGKNMNVFPVAISLAARLEIFKSCLEKPLSNNKNGIYFQLHISPYSFRVAC